MGLNLSHTAIGPRANPAGRGIASYTSAQLRLMHYLSLYRVSADRTDRALKLVEKKMQELTDEDCNDIGLLLTGKTAIWGA